MFNGRAKYKYSSSSSPSSSYSYSYSSLPNEIIIQTSNKKIMTGKYNNDIDRLSLVRDFNQT
jgi:hypothetical protein